MQSPCLRYRPNIRTCEYSVTYVRVCTISIGHNLFNNYPAYYLVNMSHKTIRLHTLQCKKDTVLNYL